MTKLKNARLIGVFILGGLAVLIAMIMLFGSGEYFKEKESFVMYFESSLSGLNIGASVKFRGVTVGKVTDITIQAWEDYHYVYTPVVIEIYLDKFNIHKPSMLSSRDLSKLIQKGLKGQLKPESFVTGILYIELDFNPEKASFFRDIKHAYPEIPTVPSDFKQLEEKLENLQLDKIIDHTRELVDNANRFFSDAELTKTVAQLDQTLKSFQELGDNLNQEIKPLSENLKYLMQDTRQLLVQVNKVLPELTSNTNQFVVDAKRAVTQLEHSLEQFDSALSDDSKLYAATIDALEDLSQASQTINNLGDYLERNPETLIWGK